jgi:hypothetical protein
MSQEVVTAFLFGVAVGQWLSLRQLIESLKDTFKKRNRRN